VAKVFFFFFEIWWCFSEKGNIVTKEFFFLHFGGILHPNFFIASYG
jgi:hypothetical protein